MSEAHSQIDRPHSRRNFVAGAATAALALMVPAAAIATPSPDEHLVALWRRYNALQKLLDVANDAYEAAKTIAEAEYPPRPIGAIVLYRPKTRTMQDRDMVEAWEDACRQIDARHGVKPLSDRCDEIADQQTDIMDEILAAPVSGLQGVSVKLALYASQEPLDDCDWSGKLIHRLSSDVATLLV